MPITRLRFPAFLSLAAGAFATAAPPITVTEVVEQGQPSYRVATPGATWVYHREGGAFSSLIDPAGNDWISYRPQGGAAGNFRGIPNAVHRRDQEGNNFFHPGHAGPKGSETTLVSSKPDRVWFRPEAQQSRQPPARPDELHGHAARRNRPRENCEGGGGVAAAVICIVSRQGN